MASYTKLYFNRAAEPYVPPAWAGGWDLTGTVLVVLDGVKYGATGNTTATRAEAVATNPYRVGVIRGTSPKLSPQTFSGTLNIVTGLSESNIAADFYTRLHVTVINATTDTVHTTVINGYEESSGGGGTEWPTTSTGTALQSAQAAAFTVPNDGDDYRLVVELGYVSYNTVSTSRTGTIRYGGLNSDHTSMSDLTVGSTSTTTLAGFIEFSAAVAFVDSVVSNYSPETATDIAPLPATITQDPEALGRDLWFKYTPDATEPAIGIFAGVSDGAGAYRPRIAVWRPDGVGGYALTATPVSTAQRPYIVPLDNEARYFQAEDVSGGSGAPGASLILNARAGPSERYAPGSILITTDTGTGLPKYPHTILHPVTGEPSTLIHPVDIASESGAVLSGSARILLNDKNVRANFYLYDRDVTLLTSFSLASPTGQNNPPIGTTRSVFYIGQRQSVGTSTVWTVDADGAIGITTWTLPNHANVLNSVSPSRDETILYYTRSVAAEGIFRHDLLLDTAMTDLIAGESGKRFGDVQVLADGTLLVYVRETNVSNDVRRYDADGTLLNSYVFGLGGGASNWFIDHIAVAADDPLSFWVWFQDSSSPCRYMTFQRVRISDGAIVTEFAFYEFAAGLGNTVALGDVPPEYFNPPNSCPLLILFGEPVIGPLLWVEWPRRVP